MTSRLRRYPTYRESGVEWLGEVPQKWDVMPVKRVARINPRKSEVPRELRTVTPVTFLPMEKVEPNGTFDGSEVVPIDDVWDGFTYFRRSDVIVAKITPCFENGKGASLVDLPTDIGFGSTEFIVLRPSPRILSRYLGSLASLHAFRKLGADAMQGASGQQRVSTEFVANFKFPIPPIRLQEVIIHFLDRVESRIQRLVRAKARLIELLQEEKQAVIDCAVTRGLDPDVSLRQSGIESVGDVPASWRVVRLKSVGRIGTKLVDPRQPEFVDCVLIAPNHVQSATGRLLSQESAGQQGAESGKYTVRAGEVVYSKIRPALRKAVIAPVDALCSADMYPIAVRESIIDSKFLLTILLSTSFTRYAVDHSLRVAMPKVNREALGNAWIAVPDPSEQRKILESVANETSGLDEGISCAERQIALLREYRTRLISDVVTGKLDVQATENLPDDSDLDDQALDEQLEEVAGA